jgi:hypothetical protein
MTLEVLLRLCEKPADVFAQWFIGMSFYSVQSPLSALVE